MSIKQITIDPDEGVAYFKIRDGKVAKTKEFSEEVFLDFDSRNNLLGIELLNPSTGTLHKVGKKYHLAILDKAARPLRQILQAA